MQKRKLGDSNISVSVIGIGCWQFGGGQYWGPQNQQDVNQVVHQALDAGVNFFDTAELYNDGDSEVSLGIALQGRRSEAVIGSKISPSNMQPATLRQHCEQSLNRLGTDFLDLYMVHWPMTSEPQHVQEAFHTLQSLQQEGKIRHIGLSNHGIGQMRQVRDTGTAFVANELPYNLLSRAIEVELLPHCMQEQIGVIAYMPLQQGLLTGKYASTDEVKPMLARSRHFHHLSGDGTRHGEDGAEVEINSALPELAIIAGELGISISELALAWVIANPAISTTIVGCRNEQQLKMNLQGAYITLDPAVIERLNKMTEPVLDKLGSSPDYYENRAKSRIC